jgi:hypothetical protein
MATYAVAERGPRIAAGIGGVVVAIGAAVASAGGALIAMAAIAITWAIARRRGRPFTRGVSWLVGVGSVGAVLLIGAGVLATRLPPGTFSAVRRSMDSAAVAPPPPPPEWLRRITPPTPPQNPQLQQSLMRSAAFTAWAGTMTAVFTAGILAAYAGTLGWVASLLLLFAATGRWIPRASRAESG